ncbi:hypothetical protein KIN20_031909 [Parelaphostrongylus tenuis]|uniref:Uncharacterized protein n=1 Tax=Parelaphostrongylus tenuis TaxID=148309 RepID=A0AAD5WHM5_PARTN|nr:hypothetical protein KIN20_031909 [Parelaphostrongylus tenuis]
MESAGKQGDQANTESSGIRALEKSYDVKSADFDVDGLMEKMKIVGLDRVMKIPLAKLKSLRSLNNKPETRSLSERLSTIEFCENLIRQRAEMLKEFEERMQVVLQTDKISIAAEQEAQLEALELDIQKGLDEWKRYTLELEEFKMEYFSIVASLQERVEEFDKMVTAIEHDSEA